MSCYNRVILIGHTTRDPLLKYTAANKAMCEIGLALNERFKRDEKWVEEVTFVNITFWGKIAETVHEYCPKGTPLLVEGKLRLDTWEKDGLKQSMLRVTAQQMRMLGGPKKGNELVSSGSKEPLGTVTAG